MSLDQPIPEVWNTLANSVPACSSANLERVGHAFHDRRLHEHPPAGGFRRSPFRARGYVYSQADFFVGAGNAISFPRSCPRSSPALCHSHPHWQRTESHNRGFFRSALHTAHDLIHMVLLHRESDRDLDSPIATGLSIDGQTIVCTSPVQEGPVNIVHTRFLTPYWRVALPPTPIVPIGARPFHPEHPSVFSDESVFPVQPQVAQKAGP